MARLTTAERAERDAELAAEARGWADGLKAGSRAARDNERKRAQERAEASKKSGRLRERPYHPASRNSWFLDKLTVARSQRQDGMRLGGGAVREAEERLARLAAEQRDIGIGDWPYVATPTPPYLVDLFASSVKARAKLAGVFPVAPLSPSGLETQTARLTSAATAAARADGGNVAESSPTAELVAAPVGEIAGMIDAGRILYSRTDGTDALIARELGEAVATALDDALLYGDGTSPNISGLSDTAGITSTAFAGSTQQDLAIATLRLVADVATAVGHADRFAILLHPRRAAWLAATVGTPAADGVFSGIMPPLVGLDLSWQVVPTIRTSLGAGTNEDELYVVALDELPVLLGPLTIAVHEDTAGGATGVVRVSAYQFASTLFVRKPEAIGRLTGLAAPSF